MRSVVSFLVTRRRKYAWNKDGQRLVLHEGKYTQTDSRGELRVKGASEVDSGVYTCISTTSNPRGKNVQSANKFLVFVRSSRSSYVLCVHAAQERRTTSR